MNKDGIAGKKEIQSMWKCVFSENQVVVVTAFGCVEGHC